MKNSILLIACTLLPLIVRSQTYPVFGQEIQVTISGLSFDAMEPFISPDGYYLFFNSLNDGVNTKLYYATKVNDSTFNFVGELNGTNQGISPRLDAVADMDSLNNFYWTSTRGYPAELENLFHGIFSDGNVTGIGRVRGDFNKNIPGWLVMDHGISYDGQFLYYNNARFDNDNCQGICETEIGIAQKVNDSTFDKLVNSDIILQNVHDASFIYYAPCISSDNLELYYTRYPRGSITPGTVFEICVAVRSSAEEIFSEPVVLFSELISNLVEAPTLTADRQIMYYHKKTGGIHKIMMRYRDNVLGIAGASESDMPVSVFPNPTTGKLNIKTELNYEKIIISVMTLSGKTISATANQTFVDINSLSPGKYLLKIEIDDHLEVKKIIKIE